MFSKTNTPKQTPEARRPAQKTSMVAVPSLLGKDLVVTGDLKSEGDIQIDGRLEGNVSAARITIGEHGAVNGSIKGKEVYVRGKVTGKISANVVELAETANVQADVIQDRLTVANGAFFDGKCSRLSKKPIAPPAPVSAPTQTFGKKTA